MFKNTKSCVETGILDVELLETYITENLGGVIGIEYAESNDRINVLDEYIPLRKTFEEKGYEVIWTELEPDKIIVNTPECVMVFIANTNRVTVDGVEFTSDRMAYIEEGRTYISADCVELCVNN